MHAMTTGSNPATPFISAIKARDNAAITALLRSGTELRETTTDGKPVLIHALEEKLADTTIQQLITATTISVGTPIEKNAVSDALMWTIVNKKEALALQLIEQLIFTGKTVWLYSNCISIWGKSRRSSEHVSPLHLAAIHGLSGVAALLCNLRDVHPETQRTLKISWSNVTHSRSSGSTAVETAIKYQQWGVLETMLRSRDFSEGLQLDKVLTWAFTHGHEQAAIVIINVRAARFPWSYSATEILGQISAGYPAQQFTKVAQLLLDSGARVDKSPTSSVTTVAEIPPLAAFRLRKPDLFALLMRNPGFKADTAEFIYQIVTLACLSLSHLSMLPLLLNQKLSVANLETAHRQLMAKVIRPEESKDFPCRAGVLKLLQGAIAAAKGHAVSPPLSSHPTEALLSAARTGDQLKVAHLLGDEKTIPHCSSQALATGLCMFLYVTGSNPAAPIYGVNPSEFKAKAEEKKASDDEGKGAETKGELQEPTSSSPSTSAPTVPIVVKDLEGVIATIKRFHAYDALVTLSESGTSPLHEAFKLGVWKTIESLLANAPRTQLLLQDSNGRLAESYWSGSKEGLESLLRPYRGRADFLDAEFYSRDVKKSNAAQQSKRQKIHNSMTTAPDQTTCNSIIELKLSTVTGFLKLKERYGYIMKGIRSLTPQQYSDQRAAYQGFCNNRQHFMLGSWLNPKPDPSRASPASLVATGKGTTFSAPPPARDSSIPLVEIRPVSAPALT